VRPALQLVRSGGGSGSKEPPVASATNEATRYYKTILIDSGGAKPHNQEKSQRIVSDDHEDAETDMPYPSRNEFQAELRSIRADMQASQEGLRTEFANMRVGLIEAISKIAQTQTETAAKFSELQGEMRSDLGLVRGEMGAVRGEIGNLRGELGEIRGSVDGLKTVIGSSQWKTNVAIGVAAIATTIILAIVGWKQQGPAAPVPAPVAASTPSQPPIIINNVPQPPAAITPATPQDAPQAAPPAIPAR